MQPILGLITNTAELAATSRMTGLALQKIIWIFKIYLFDYLEQNMGKHQKSFVQAEA